MPMTIYSYSAWIITFAAVISYLNYRFIRLPATVAIMAASLLISFLLLVMASIKLPGLLEEIKILVAEAHFSELVMNFMLGPGNLILPITNRRNEISKEAAI